jgi:hypothetical protein
MAKKELVEKKDLHEYEVTLEATYPATETATIFLMASNETEAEEMAITETQDGQHFGDGEFVGEEGFYDADFEAINVERTDGEEEEEDDGFD